MPPCKSRGGTYYSSVGLPSKGSPCSSRRAFARKISILFSIISFQQGRYGNARSNIYAVSVWFNPRATHMLITTRSVMPLLLLLRHIRLTVVLVNWLFLIRSACVILFVFRYRLTASEKVIVSLSFFFQGVFVKQTASCYCYLSVLCTEAVGNSRVTRTLWTDETKGYPIAPPPFIEGETGFIFTFRLRHKTAVFFFLKGKEYGKSCTLWIIRTKRYIIILSWWKGDNFPFPQIITNILR